MVKGGGRMLAALLFVTEDDDEGDTASGITSPSGITNYELRMRSDR